jgi:NAD(P)-dependent dehydrogenase (short-subunit alcohol dehydrogenase family)
MDTNDVKFLSGRTAIVTGGATGIGRAITIALAQAGAAVAVGSRTARTSTFTDAVDPQAGRIVTLPLDVTSSSAVTAFYAAVRSEFGQVDILVNSAGVMPDHLLTDHPDALWEETINVNLNGVYRMVKVTLPDLIEQGWGRIITVASTAASVSAPGFGAYSASKAGVLGLMRAAALEGAPHGVTCNAISPGWVETAMAVAAIKRYAAAEGRDFAEYMAAIKQSNPQKRMIQPAEIGALVLYLCRDDALGMTMQDLIFAAGSLW